MATLSRRRFGFADMPKSNLYSRKIVRERGIHVFDAYCEMLRVIGRQGRPPLVRLQAPPAAHEAVGARLRSAQPEFGTPLAIIHPGAGKEYRQWPAQRFAAVADELVRRHRMNVCVIGAPGEAELMRAVIESMTLARMAFPLSLPLIELLALCERASILLSNESGPTHLAAATDLPIVTIFGPSKEAIWRPIREEGTIVLRGAQCDPRCGKRKCYADRRCLMSLGTGQVLEAVEAVLGWGRAAAGAHQRANDTVEPKS
jgi:ADP-heptose:LPS heptosyltransferase